ncbi:MAG: small basic protein [Planctomycetota bacterium]
MTIHKSLKSTAKLTRSRNVWTRLERIEVLKKDGRFKEGGTIFGLPKVRTSVKVAKGPAQ